MKLTGKKKTEKNELVPESLKPIASKKQEDSIYQVGKKFFTRYHTGLGPAKSIVEITEIKSAQLCRVVFLTGEKAGTEALFKIDGLQYNRSLWKHSQHRGNRVVIPEPEDKE